ncbi:MAG: lipoprotein [Oscillospiraceae bacterium]
MKKILALLLAIMMIASMAACGAKEEAAPAVEEAPAAEAPAAEAPAAPAAEAPTDDLTEWKNYLKEYAVAGAPSEEEGQAVSALIDEAATVEDVEAISQLTVLFENVGVLKYNDWIAAGKPAAQAAGIGSEADKQGASGEMSGEPTDEPA